MPVLDVQMVLREGARPRAGLARALADAAAEVLGAATGQVWVRVGALPLECYAENGVSPAELPLPVFVRVLHRQLPSSSALAAEAKVLSAALAAVIGCASERVHIEYSPPGQGRVAFGGNLVQ